MLTGVGNTGGAGADSDADVGTSGRIDALVVVNAKDSSDGVYAAVAAGTTSADGTTVDGDYGSLKIGADGSYVYTTNNAQAVVQALAVGETLTDTFTYQVHDGVGGYNTAELTVTINGTNDAPTITGTDDNETIVETNASGRTATGTLTLGDLDYSNTVSTQVHSVSIAGGSETTGLASELLNNTDDALLNLMSLTDGSLANNEVSDTFDWTFNSSSYTFDYLSEGESLILDYTIRATDSNDPAGTVDRVGDGDHQRHERHAGHCGG